MDYRTLIVEVKGQIGWVTLNRPEVMNAINQEMSRDLISACSELERDEQVRVVIFKASGEKAFSAGMDLTERAEGEGPSFIERRQLKIASGIHTHTRAIAAMTKPTVAVVRGYAVGGGLEITLACDLRVVSEDAKLGLMEVRRGIIPGSGGTQRLSRIVGLGKALEICLSGELIDGREAHRIGLANALVSADNLLQTAERLAASLIKGAPLSLRFTKEAIHKGFELLLEEGLRLEADLSALVATTEDSKEGPRAFVEKRAPVWKGK